MWKFLLFTAVLGLVLFGVAFARVQQRSVTKHGVQPKQTLYDLTAETIGGKALSLETFRGKPLLIVNVASKCGYTPQYADLQKLHEQYGELVTILGFPANDFGRQEPGSDEEIAEFCQVNYGVTFQMMSKVHVKGKEIHPVYHWLTDPELNGWNQAEPSWNFCKYLIDADGRLVGFYKSGVKPLSDELLSAIKSLDSNEDE
ncbi:MAG: glutathione peroxidase [Candidatus Marinimicrobia bacterium]|nr:glutathione peroxidase [Candidatus Neomarinimicrobiota bacterium]MCF7902404.1 glutathione peroxidase [Candidatus Neomarinimicrobiota bacterium]